MGKIPKLPKINWRLFITVILIIVIIITIFNIFSKRIFKDDKEVEHMVLSKEQVPEKINEILPKYKMLERALAAKVDDHIYVIVTRGEKLTAGYEVNIEKLEVIKEDEDVRLIVHAIFKDPSPDDIVTQSMTHPYVVAKTELKKLPVKIDLEIKQEE